MSGLIIMNPMKKKIKKTKKNEKTKQYKKPTLKIKGFHTIKPKSKTKPKQYKEHKDIVIINPKKEIKKMAKSKKMAVVSKAAQKFKHRAKLSLLGLNLKEAIPNSLFLGIGMLMAQFVSKRFSDTGGVADNWSMKNYLLAPLGGFGLGALVSGIMGGKTKHGQYIFMGALAYTLFKAFHSEVVQNSPALQPYFGEGEPLMLGQNESQSVAIGDIWRGDNETNYVMGANGWYPVDESHRMGDDIVSMNPVLGDNVVSMNPVLGFGDTQPLFKRFQTKATAI